MNAETPKPKINIFALPSQTAMLFWLLTATLLGMILLGSIDPDPVPIIGLLPPTLILLSLRGFLERPDREIRQKHLQPAGERFPLLRKTIEENAHLINLKRIPQLLIDEKRNELYEMGSFTRWYIVSGVERAQTLEIWLASPESAQGAQGILLHELHHFKTGDYWQLGYLTELFQITFRLMLWILGFFGGLIFLIALIGPPVLQMSPDSILKKLPEENRPLFEQVIPSIVPPEAQRQALQEKAAGIDLGAVFMFIGTLSSYVIVLAAILWRFYRPRLWQMREFYADSGMVQSMGTMTPVWDIFKLNRVSNKSNVIPSQGWIIHFMETISHIYNQLRKLIVNTDFWPPFNQRVNALAFPQNVFYDWKKIAWLLGSLMLFLEMFLDSPFNLPYVGDNSISLVTLMFVMATAYFLLPHILMGKSGWWEGLLIVVIVNFIRTVWLFLSIMLMWGLYWFDPNTLLGVLYYGIASTARYAGKEIFELNVLDFLQKATIANFLQVPIILVIQASSVLALVLLFRRVAGWYSFCTTNRIFRRTIFCLTLWVLFILYSLILPLANRIFQIQLSLVEPLNIFMAVLGILMGIAGSIWFFVQDRRYHQKCPACREKVIVSNFVGAACPSCNQILYPWLVTNYEDE